MEVTSNINFVHFAHCKSLILVGSDKLHMHIVISTVSPRKTIKYIYILKEL
jgi:hypothetical protein